MPAVATVAPAPAAAPSAPGPPVAYQAEKELRQHLLRSIPEYSGERDASKVYNFVNAVRTYFEADQLAATNLLTAISIAGAKLKGTASMWFYANRYTFASLEDSPQSCAL